MLSNYTMRRVAAVLALIGTTNAAGFVGAQPPAAKTGKKTPTLISNCDYTVSNCNGDPALGGGGTFGGYTPPEDDAPRTCTSGTLIWCGVDTSYTCSQWVIVSGSGSGSVNGGITWGGSASGTVTKVCGTWTFSIRNLTWSK